MTHSIIIKEDDIEGFSGPARRQLEIETKEYLDYLIQESYRIEAAQNRGSGEKEITQNIVADAAVLVRRLQPKKNLTFKLIALRASAAILPLLVGFFFNASSVKDGTNLIYFVLFLTVTVGVVIVSVTKEP